MEQQKKINAVNYAMQIEVFSSGEIDLTHRIALNVNPEMEKSY